MNVISKVIVGTLLISSVEARRGGGGSRRGRQGGRSGGRRGARGAPVELLTACQDDINDVCKIDVTAFINGEVFDRAVGRELKRCIRDLADDDEIIEECSDALNVRRGAPAELLTACQDDIEDVCAIDVTGILNGDDVDRATKRELKNCFRDLKDDDELVGECSDALAATGGRGGRGMKGKFDVAQLEACQTDIEDFCELTFDVTVLIDTLEGLQGAEDDVPGDAKAELRSMGKEVKKCFKRTLKGNDELSTSCANALNPESNDTGTEK